MNIDKVFVGLGPEAPNIARFISGQPSLSVMSPGENVSAPITGRAFKYSFAGHDTRSLRSKPHMLADHVGELFADHDSRSVGVAGDHGRHDRGIGDTQPVDPAHPQLGINDR